MTEKDFESFRALSIRVSVAYSTIYNGVVDLPIGNELADAHHKTGEAVLGVIAEYKAYCLEAVKFAATQVVDGPTT